VTSSARHLSSIINRIINIFLRATTSCTFHMYAAPAHFSQCPTHHPATSKSITDAPLEIQAPVMDVNVKGKGKRKIYTDRHSGGEESGKKGRVLIRIWLTSMAVLPSLHLAPATQRALCYFHTGDSRGWQECRYCITYTYLDAHAPSCTHK